MAEVGGENAIPVTVSRNIKQSLKCTINVPRKKGIAPLILEDQRGKSVIRSPQKRGTSRLLADQATVANSLPVINA